MSNLDITIAIPTYNGEKRISAVLEKLRLQTGTEAIKWEVIVIDNNSSDDTSKVIYEYQQNWHLSAPLIYVFEAKQGLSFARQRAVKEAQGKLIAFLDDDNLPQETWVKEVYLFGKDKPSAGAFSGHIHGDFQVQPPESLKPVLQFLAIREHGEKPRLFQPEKLQLPPGAGLVIRKQAWCENVPIQPKVVGNMGTALARGDDYEPLLYIHKAGWEIWYNPAMHIDHQIPSWRLEKDYLLSLAHCCGLATCQLLMINATTWQKPWIWWRTLLGNLRRTILHLIKYKGKLKTDLVAAFQLKFFLGSMLSPFYFLKVAVSKCR